MLNSTLQIMQTAAGADVARAAVPACRPEPRPATVTAAAYQTGTIRVAGTASTGLSGLGSIIGSAWSAIATRKPMTVNAFHDRWPLCSST